MIVAAAIMSKLFIMNKIIASARTSHTCSTMCSITRRPVLPSSIQKPHALCNKRRRSLSLRRDASQGRTSDGATVIDVFAQGSRRRGAVGHIPNTLGREPSKRGTNSSLCGVCKAWQDLPGLPFLAYLCYGNGGVAGSPGMAGTVHRPPKKRERRPCPAGAAVLTLTGVAGCGRGDSTFGADRGGCAKGGGGGGSGHAGYPGGGHRGNGCGGAIFLAGTMTPPGTAAGRGWGRAGRSRASVRLTLPYVEGGVVSLEWSCEGYCLFVSLRYSCFTRCIGGSTCLFFCHECHRRATRRKKKV